MDVKRYNFNSYDGEVAMEESPDGDYVTHADYLAMKSQRDDANLRWYEEHMRIWKEVVSTDVYQDLKHGKYKDILTLLSDGEISVGKAAEAITERAGGLSPLLPDWNPPEQDADLSWRERYDKLKSEFDENLKITG